MDLMEMTMNEQARQIIEQADINREQAIINREQTRHISEQARHISELEKLTKNQADINQEQARHISELDKILREQAILYSELIAESRLQKEEIDAMKQRINTLEDSLGELKYLERSLKGQEHLNFIRKRVHEIAQQEETEVSEMIRRSQKENTKSTIFIVKARITSFEKRVQKVLEEKN
jgi:hypothetical protein